MSLLGREHEVAALERLLEAGALRHRRHAGPHRTGGHRQDDAARRRLERRAGLRPDPHRRPRGRDRARVVRRREPAARLARSRRPGGSRCCATSSAAPAALRWRSAPRCTRRSSVAANSSRCCSRSTTPSGSIRRRPKRSPSPRTASRPIASRCSSRSAPIATSPFAGATECHRRRTRPQQCRALVRSRWSLPAEVIDRCVELDRRQSAGAAARVRVAHARPAQRATSDRRRRRAARATARRLSTRSWWSCPPRRCARSR